ncbi:helix-hairpin-helix domain-containing protein [Thermomonas sp.]|uniref:helix-hairpin-helix domain-containing protein n=1 Tax=Thermomonas sp. TaxID=1971895 RepID=UPI00391D9EBD
MNPARVRRNAVRTLADLPNVGPATAADLRLLGVEHPGQLVGRDPVQLYDDLCWVTGVRHDPCVIDVFVSITAFLAGDEPKPWWAYTAQRKTVQRKR